MKIGILVCTYNRPHYLKECLESLSRADMPEGTKIVIIDDASTNSETLQLIEKWWHSQADQRYVNPSCVVLKYSNKVNSGIKQSLRIDQLPIGGLDCYDLIINIDGDAVVRNDFVTELVKLHNRFPENMISGFECTNQNDDGSPRHNIISQGEGYKTRQTVGGINLCFTPKMYNDWILPALLEPVGNWDQKSCLNAGNSVICASPSLIQHIGLESSMGHSSSAGTMADISDSFKALSLPMVTLIGIDSNKERLQPAFEESTKQIHFGAVKLLNEPLNSKQAYSDFCVKELYKHIDTSHLLIIQWDGYVKNWKAWDKEWLQYDYIGAPWEWYTDGMQVGNGGFSLRSKRLMEIVATDPVFATHNHPEDHVICRTHRKYLETTYGIKFARIEVARKFSIEGFNHWDKTHNGQFGFHSTQIKFQGEQLPGIGKTAYMQQYFGIGDVIFSMQIARNLQKQGYKIFWPVLPDYVEQLNRAYPDITFMDIWLTQPKFMENRELVARGSTYYVPLRFTYDLMKVPFKDCMRSKYDFMHMDWETWRQAEYVRDEVKEKSLLAELGITPGESYTLVNRMFRSDNKGKAAFEQPTTGKIIEMTIRPNFSLFDWSIVIENATEIHTVSTSIVYILEMLELKAEKVYIYIRRPNESNHDNYKELLTRHIGKYVYMP